MMIPCSKCRKDGKRYLLLHFRDGAKAKIKIDRRRSTVVSRPIRNFISVLDSSVHERYKKIDQISVSFHFWKTLQTDKKDLRGNKSCESTEPQIYLSIWVKWSTLRQLAIETGENWIELLVQSAVKFDFIRLSLSNPQSGQSLFLLFDDSILGRFDLYTGCCISNICFINADHSPETYTSIESNITWHPVYWKRRG